jgi:hypothetical protein
MDTDKNNVRTRGNSQQFSEMALFLLAALYPLLQHYQHQFHTASVFSLRGFWFHENKQAYCVVV